MNNVNTLLKLASVYENRCQQDLAKLAKINKLPDGRYRVISHTGENEGTYKSREGAEKKNKRVEYLKNFDHSEADDKLAIDLTKIDEFAYSAIMRQLRQKGTPEQIRQFLQLYKQQFDKAVKGKIHKPERIALQNAMVRFNKLHKVKLDKTMIKTAAVAELGNSEQVGRYLADIVRFTLQRLPADKRQHALNSLKQKFAIMNESEISSKQLPESSALGQAITFVKHILFNHDSRYVKEVLLSLSRDL